MSDSRKLRRAVAEMDPGVAQSQCAGIGNHSIHQFWHLFAPHFRGVLLAPRRRPDNGNVTWGWRETADSRPLTAAELAEVRLRLANANRSLKSGLGGGKTRGDANLDDSGDQSLDVQVGVRVEGMTAELIAKSDRALAGYVCRTETGTMLHSWGAATPAQPVFPDTQQGEISGMVLMDGAGTAGLSIVLENQSGLSVAHAKSDRTGAFRFQNIAPGHYRLRVADRTDFPADGWPIRMERAALTGLELRGGSTSPALTAQTDRPPRQARRWPAILLVLLALLGAGAGLWRLKRPATTATTTKGNQAAGWQSANGTLVASTGEAARTDVRVGQSGGGWSDLSRKLPEPKMPKSSQHRQPSPSGAGIPADQPTVNDAPGLSETRARPGMLSDTNSLVIPKPVRVDLKQADQTRSATPAHSTDRASVESENEAQRKGEEAAPTEVEDNPTNPQPVAAAARRPARLGTSLTAADTVEREEQTPGAALHSSTTSTSTNSKAAGKPASSVSAGSRNGAGSTQAAPGADATSSTGPQTASASGQGTAATNHLAANVGARQPERMGATDGDGAALLSSVDTASGDRAAETAPATTEPPTDKTTPRAPKMAKNKANRPEADPSATKAAVPANAAAEDDAPKTPATPAAQVSMKPAPKRAEAISGSGGIAGRSADDAVETMGLKQPGRIRASVWRPHLLQDLILPTLPVAAGQNDSLEELREKLLQVQRARMPQTFRGPVTGNGFALEFDPTGETDSPHWRDAAGAEPAEATVQGNRAELTWTGRGPTRGQDYVLGYRDGREIARVSPDSTGAPVLKTARNVRGWYWLGIEQAAADAAGSASAASRFNWRLLSGEAIPSSWRRDDHWRTGRGQRLDLPLDSGGVPGRYPLALVDRVTGWALTCEIGVQ